ncbi:MAG: dicarboxylate/amino acid:cation symporter [Bdellovibrionota bacterium]
MKKFLKTYKSSIILISSVILGGIFGIFFKNQVLYIKPIGDLFFNILFMMLPPLIFFCVVSSFTNFNIGKRLNKILKYTIIVFIATSIVSSLIGLIAIYIYNPAKGLSAHNFKNILEDASYENIKTLQNSLENFSLENLLDSLTKIFTTNDFYLLLSKNYILPLIVFSMLSGLAITRCDKKPDTLCKFLNDGKNVMLELINFIMKFAPLGLGVYFANVVASLGPKILTGYLNLFILYLIVAIITYFLVFSFYAYLGGGKKGLVLYWKNVLPPTVMSLGSCSSAASLPTNMIATKKMNVSEDVCDISLPLGVNIHKDGSIIGNIFKITFLLTILGQDFSSFSFIIIIILVAFISSVVIGAIPSGGIMGEVALLSMLHLPQEFLPLILIISTIIDAPATLLNSVGNTASAMIISRLVNKDKDKDKDKN